LVPEHCIKKLWERFVTAMNSVGLLLPFGLIVNIIIQQIFATETREE
jgi:hypothetical protein